MLLLTCLAILSGCWDRTELKQLGIAVGVAVDKDADTGNYIFSSLMLRPAAFSAQSNSTSRSFEKVVTNGKTIFEAIRKVNLEFDRIGFYGHNKIILISEELAKGGIMPILDSFQRGKEFREYVYICIVKNAEASEILDSTASAVTILPAIHLRNLVDHTDIQFSSAKIDILNFYKQALASGIAPVVGVLEFEEDKFSKKHVKISGGGVFNKDKLVGYLNEKETRGYRWGKGEVKTAVISVPSPVDEERFDTVEVRNVKSKIKPTIKGDEISFTISVSGEGIIAEQQSTATFESPTERLNYSRKMEEKMKKIIEKEIKTAMEKAQKKLKSDIFGFGNALNQEDPKTWNKVKKDWTERFTEVPYTVSVNFSVKTTGLMGGPFQSEN